MTDVRNGGFGSTTKYPLRHPRSFMGNTKAGKCDEFINHRYLLLLFLSFFQILQKAFFKQAPAGNLFKDHRKITLMLPQEISLKITGEITLKVFRQLLLPAHSVKQCQMR